MNKIPVDKLQEKTSLGFQLKVFNPENDGQNRLEALGAHRDDHYIFFLITQGSGSVVVDFQEKIVRQNQLYYILPQQVDYKIKANQAAGWFVAVDAALIDPEYQTVFERYLGSQTPLTLTPDGLFDYNQLLSLVHRQLSNDGKDGLNVKLLHTLIQPFLAMAANTFANNQELRNPNSRTSEIARLFKKLLGEHIRQYKEPSWYAGMLYISEPYLNEAVKKTTGSTVTYWITQEVLTEAKRMLYFTNLNVKQIADDLGYENYSYFCRLFKKEAGISALAFRNAFRHPVAELDAER